jgi:hypothetical protein
VCLRVREKKGGEVVCMCLKERERDRERKKSGTRSDRGKRESRR